MKIIFYLCKQIDDDAMNVKFKMPNFKRNLKGKAVWKELLMTVIGTSISIVLTFGTAHLIEQHQKHVAGRQTAMMAIHDVDDAVVTLRKMARMEDENFQQASYVLNNFDRIASIGEDTLANVYAFITRQEINFSDASERTFLSSQDAWKNINNAQFIDIIQAFYQNRRESYDLINSHYLWRQPLTNEDEYQFMLAADGYMINYAEILAEKLLDKRVKCYIEFSPARQRTYNNIADNWQKCSSQAKFTLGITDAEMNDFLEQKERYGRPLSKSELLGRWLNIQSADNRATMEFRKDNTLIYSLTSYVANPFYTGRHVINRTNRGTWQLDGDSLFLLLTNSFDFSIDDSQVNCSEWMKDSLENFVAHIRKDFMEAKKQRDEQPDKIELRRAAFIDDSDSKIELRHDVDIDTENASTETEYLTREE